MLPVLCGIPHTQKYFCFKNKQAKKINEIMELAGYVAAGITVIITHGLSYPMNTVVSFIGHLVARISQWLPSMICILHCHISLFFSIYCGVSNQILKCVFPLYVPYGAFFPQAQTLAEVFHFISSCCIRQ